MDEKRQAESEKASCTLGAPIALLARQADKAGAAPSVIETHGAIIVLAGDTAWKLKKPVRLSYLDFSTLERRRRVLERELEINRPHAPDIYLGLSAITRAAGGALELDGTGEPVEWALRMRRFPAGDLLSERARQAPFTTDLSRGLADAVHAFHAAAPVATADTAGEMRCIVEDVAAALARAPWPDVSTRAETFKSAGLESLSECRGILDRRSAAGLVRRCHGDLHLGNVVLWQGRPVLFDAIEFDERLAEIDTLYDLAFLLMDLDVHGQRASANVVLNRYLWCTQRDLDLDGLKALPLFTGLRAGVRAMVAADRGLQSGGRDNETAKADCIRYLDAALVYFMPLEPCLVAIGGLSGTGKSTLGAALAPGLGRCPGAVHLRSDLERKAMAGCAETYRLAPHHYTKEASQRVYARLFERAGRALAAGQCIVADAVFAGPEERAAIEQVARDLNVPFIGLWLDARLATMIERVEARKGDASDATGEVVTRQSGYETGRIAWHKLDAGGSREATFEQAAGVLGKRWSKV